MSYSSISALSQDPDLKARLAACAAVEGKGDGFPEWWVESNKWTLAITPGWGDSYAYAVAVGNERPGNDESVITDAMILAAVQPLAAAVPAS